MQSFPFTHHPWLHPKTNHMPCVIVNAGTITGQRLEQELADLKAAVACAKDSKQAQEEHYLKQIIKVSLPACCAHTVPGLVLSTCRSAYARNLPRGTGTP